MQRIIHTNILSLPPHTETQRERERGMAEGDLAAAKESSGGSLTTTPTWAVATVCFFMIAASLLIEHGIHLLSQYFNRRRRKALIRALDQIKTELMMMGFLSLLLTVCEKPIANICIPRSVGHTLLPCGDRNNNHHSGEEAKCKRQGKVSLISRNGVQQLQLLIFIFTAAHVISCFVTFTLGMLKMTNWETWEAQTKTLDYQFANDPRRFQLAHQTTFGRRHMRFWSDLRLLRLPASFFRQFYESVSKVDYLTLRHGFIKAHFEEESTFDFQKYLQKALEKDFGVVVAVSPWIWMLSILFILFNADKFRTHNWFPFIPLGMLLVVGTKLQGIITRMCLDSNDKSLVVRGTLLVKPSDDFFWFRRPKLLLHFIHFILVQNSFQLAFFAWTWQKFGLRSCFHHRIEDIVVKIVTGLLVQFLCGYVTLPLYALVTQMGTSIRKAHIFPPGVIKGLRRWQKRAQKNIKRKNAPYSIRSLDTSLETSLASSPSHSNHGASFSHHLGKNYTLDGRFSEIDIVVDEAEGQAVIRTQNSQKLGSFRGFHIGQ